MKSLLQSQRDGPVSGRLKLKGTQVKQTDLLNAAPLPGFLDGGGEMGDMGDAGGDFGDFGGFGDGGGFDFGGFDF